MSRPIFFRRTNMNAAGKPRSWTDHLLWHHRLPHRGSVCQYQTDQHISQCYALEGPPHPELGIAMDMGIGLKVPSGAICTLSLSFNNKGPQGTFFRYIGDSGTYVAYYDDLVDGEREQNRPQQSGRFHERHRVAGSRILRRHQREARTEFQNVQQTISAMQTLDRLERMLKSKVGAVKLSRLIVKPVAAKYHWTAHESIAEGLQRIAGEQLELAISELVNNKASLDKAVHEARKSVKKTRSTLRLVRGVLE